MEEKQTEDFYKRAFLVQTHYKWIAITFRPNNKKKDKVLMLKH